MKIDNPKHVHAYFENLAIASLLVPNYKDDSTIQLFLKQFGEVSEQHSAQPLGFTLQSLLLEARKSVDEPADLLEKFDANLGILAGAPDAALKKAFLDTLQATLNPGMEDACSKSRLLEPALNLLGGRSGAASAQPQPAATMIAQQTRVAQQNSVGAATVLATQQAGPGATVLVAQTRTATATRQTTNVGAPQKKSEHMNALSPGYRLNEFEFDRVLGVGGFGITYLGKDTTLNLKVAIKEYFPNELAVRDENLNVLPKSPDCEETYRWGLDRFLQEAQLLARFNHPNIVRVLRFFEANDTAYMMMQYEDGESLDDKLKKAGAPPDEDYLQRILFPLLDGLKAMHDQGFLHRDIKPGNIYIRRSDGSPVLLDFGAARAQMRGNEQLTAIVTPGYAPFEQYFADGYQGPWSDIYAFGAVVYKAITGKPPPEAASRVKNDTMAPAIQVGQGRYSDKFLRAIDWALQTDEKKRPQTIEDWQRALTSLDGVTQRPSSGGIQPGAGEMTRTMAAPGRSQLLQSSPKTTFSQLHEAAPFSAPEETHFYQERQPRIRLRTVLGIVLLVSILGGGAYFVQNPEALRYLAFKAADWGWRNENYEISLPIYKFYDNPTDAQTPYKVATLYDEGKGAEVDKTEAHAWYQKAAERGNPDAALKLAQMLERGDGVEANAEQALAWYIRAAEQEQVDAQYRLGIAYLREDALKLTPSPSESAKWLRMAATQGHKQARDLLKLTH
ncbi:MAG: serine/threonine-protein kinase [Sulfuricellaceae bacterium]